MSGKVHSRNRRGNAAFTSVTILVLIGFGALTLDIGRARVVQAQLKNAAEAGAHAGVAELDGTTAGMTAAVDAAVDLAGLNTADNQAVAIDASDVTLGVWEDGDGFTESADPAEVNAVRVDLQDANVEPIFAGVAFGRDTLGAAAASIAVRGETEGAGATDCFLPFALPLCIFDGRTDEALNLIDLKLQPATGDNIGWGSPWGTPSTSMIIDQLTGECDNGEVEIGDRLWLGNGSNASALSQVASSVSSSSTRWDASNWGAQPGRMTGSAISSSNYGKTLEGVILLFDGGPAYCDNNAATGNWNPSTPATVAGFAWGAVYDVKTSGSASSRNIKMRLEMLDEYEFGTEGGGPDNGVTFKNPDRVVY